MKIAYTKMNGAGNDYIYVDNTDNTYDVLSEANFARIAQKVSDRKTGIGSDGLIVLERSEKSDALLRMRMFNADGSEGKMCGNGIRCVAKLCYEKFGERPSYKVSTLSGIRECFILDRSNAERFVVKVNMGRPSFLPDKIPVVFEDVMVMDEEFEVLDRTFKISCVNMGNPHCVIEVEDLKNFDIERYASIIQKHEVFPESVNVEFIEAEGDGIFQRTFERGSGETKACGTGACAVGVSLILKKQRRSPVDIRLLGGNLRVEWDGLREVWLTGDAVTESTGTFDA